MKITDVEAFHLSIPLSKSGPQVPSVWSSVRQVIVRIRTADGLTGYGEAFGYGVPAAVAAVVNHSLKPLLLGADAAAISATVGTLFRKTHLFGRYGVTTFAISGVEITLWDLAGKRAGKPLYDLIGGAADKRVQAYASLVRFPEGDPRIAEQAGQASKEGYGMIKLHQVDPDSVRQAREAIGAEMPLTVDINCEWTPLEALEKAIEMDEYDLHWLEEPVWPPEDYQGLAAVQEGSGVPLASGENACTAHQFKALLDAGAASYVQPSVTKVGGIGEFLKVAALVETHNVRLAPHSPYFGPGFLATLHLIAHTRQADWVERFYFNLDAEIFTAPLPLKEGFFTLPEGPGLGLDVDERLFKEYKAKE